MSVLQAVRRRIVLLADGKWGVRALEHLLLQHEIVLLCGRRQPSCRELEDLARERGLELLVPDRINSAYWRSRILGCRPELILSVSYDQIFRSRFLREVGAPVINVHAGNPERYRGRAILCWQLLEGASSADLCAVQVGTGIDEGQVLQRQTVALNGSETYGQALELVCAAIPELLDAVIAQLPWLESRDSTEEGDPQALPVYYPRRRAGDEWLDWERSSAELLRQIRALAPPNPCAATTLGEDEIRVGLAAPCEGFPPAAGIPGSVVGMDTHLGLLVKTGDTAIWIRGLRSAEGKELDHTTFHLSSRFGFQKHAELNRLRRRVHDIERRLDRIAEVRETEA